MIDQADKQISVVVTTIKKLIDEKMMKVMHVIFTERN
jgi:hypothetical protein